MSIFANQFRKVHFYILLVFAAVFSVLTFWALIQQSPSDWRDNHNFTATLLAASGPFTGAIARPFEASCLRFAWGLFPYCGGILSLAVIFQFVRLPLSGAKTAQIVLWVLGLLGPGRRGSTRRQDLAPTCGWENSPDRLNGLNHVAETSGNLRQSKLAE